MLKEERESAISRLRAALERWKNNGDTARVNVRLGDLRAVVDELDEIVAHNEDMALDWAVEDRW